MGLHKTGEKGGRQFRLPLIAATALCAATLLPTAAMSETNEDPPETMAFYAFKDGLPGSAVVSVTNSVDSGRNVGIAAVKSSSKGTGSIRFSSDRPAKYIFAGKGGSLICTDPQSVRFGREAATGTGSAAAGNIEIADLGSDMSAVDEYTVEFFVNVSDDEYNDAAANLPSHYYHSIEWEAGSWQSQDPDWPSGVRGPSGIDLWENKYSYRYWYGVSTNAAGQEADAHVNYGCCMMLPRTYISDWDAQSRNLTGSLWHHVAVVHSKTDKTTHVYLDWELSDNLTKAGRALVESNDTLTCSAPLRLGNYRFYGSISCLRVTSRALALSEMMYASEAETFYPETLFHWTFDGANGAALTAVTNVAPTFRSINTNLCFITATACVPASRNGNGEVQTDALSQLYYTNAVCYAERCEVYDGEELFAKKNPSSLWLRPGEHYTSGASVSGWRIRPGVRCQKNIYGNDMLVDHDFTFETYIKLDIAEWLSDETSKTPRATLFGISDWSGGYYDWMVRLTSITDSQITLSLNAMYKNSEGKQTGMSANSNRAHGVKPYDDKWHHYAVTYDHETQTFVLYLDGEQLLSKVVPGFVFNGSDKHFYLGYGQNNESICGQYDEARLTARKLVPSEFLNFRRGKGPMGLAIVVR